MHTLSFPVAVLAFSSLAFANTVVAQPVAGAAPAAASANAIGATTSSAFENVEFFVGLDGSKQPQDLGINANMGLRLSANTGFPLSRRAGLGLQVGAAVNFSDAAVHVLDQIDGTSRRTQQYLTLGLFQQGVSKLSWALSYDFLHEHYYDDFSLGQVRGQAGYNVTRIDELGGFVTTSVSRDHGVIGETAVTLDPITQVAGYFRRTWPTSARTSAWVGVAAHHHNVVLVFPDNTRDKNVVVYGAQLEMPLSNRLSVTGSSNFVTPTATGTVDAYLGITYYPGRKTTGARGRFSPVLPVGNNPEFPVDLHR